MFDDFVGLSLDHTCHVTCKLKRDIEDFSSENFSWATACKCYITSRNAVLC